MPLFVALMEVPGIVVEFCWRACRVRRRRRDVIAYRHQLGARWRTKFFWARAWSCCWRRAAIGWFAGQRAGADVALFLVCSKACLRCSLWRWDGRSINVSANFAQGGRISSVRHQVTPVAFRCHWRFIGRGTGLSVGGATMLGVLAASASYIAAPAAMRIAIPQANPTLSIVTSLRDFSVQSHVWHPAVLRDRSRVGLTMNTHPKKLLVLIGEYALEKFLIRDAKRFWCAWRLSSPTCAAVAPMARASPIGRAIAPFAWRSFAMPMSAGAIGEHVLKTTAPTTGVDVRDRWACCGPRNSDTLPQDMEGNSSTGAVFEPLLLQTPRQI